MKVRGIDSNLGLGVYSEDVGLPVQIESRINALIAGAVLQVPA